MLAKYIEGVFGYCPRALCNNQKCLPIGLSDKLRNSRVKIFCPKCDEVYMVQKYLPAKNGVPAGVHTATNLDGAYFGSSFP
jgi:casein kinase II subunit beta